MRTSNVLALLLIAGMLAWGGPEVAAQTRIDLAIDSAQVKTPRLSQNQNVEIVASIRNNGSEAAGNIYLEVEILKEGKRVKAIKAIPVLSHLPRAGIGQGLPISIGPLAPGSYAARVVVDPDNIIEETNEGNNEKTVSFNVSTPIA